MKLLGIAGTNGSGKDTIGELLMQEHGWLFVSVTEILREEAKKRGLPSERENLRNISAQWRRESGFGVLVDQAVNLYEKLGGDSKYKGLVLASLRHPGEADRVHELGGSVVWVDADAKIRYDRINSRRRADDNKTFEQFLAEQEAEMKHSGDVATLNVSAVKQAGDIFINNDGNNIEEFKSALARRLELLVK